MFILIEALNFPFVIILFLPQLMSSSMLMGINYVHTNIPLKTITPNSYALNVTFRSREKPSRADVTGKFREKYPDSRAFLRLYSAI